MRGNKRKVLILCAHRAGRSPSQRYRFEQYLSFLNEHGFEFTFSPLLDEKSDGVFYQHGKFFKKALIMAGTLVTRLKDLRKFKYFDVIFIQREASFLGTSYFEKKAFASAAKVIFDFDDSIWLADTSPGNKKWEWLKKPEKFFDNLRYAHTIIAGNEYLAEKARRINSNTVVIPTTVDTNIHVPKPQLRNKEQVVIGWSGSISTIKHFNSIRPALKKIKEKFGDRIRFKLIADKHYHDAELELEVVTWSADTEVDHLNSFDIGLMPLPDDEWSRGKCGLKGLTYMACGVATVMSDIGENKNIIENGKDGLLVSSENDWLIHLSSLIVDHSRRETLGKNAREKVLGKYSVIANRQKMLEVFSTG